DRLGHAELIDAIAQRRQVLLDRKILPLLDALRRERRDELGRTVDLILRQRDAGIVALDDLARGIDARTGTQQHLDRIAANGDRLVLDALLAQAGTNVLREPLQCLIERGPDVDLIEEVHAAAKIQAETHRL